MNASGLTITLSCCITSIRIVIINEQHPLYIICNWRHKLDDCHLDTPCFFNGVSHVQDLISMHTDFFELRGDMGLRNKDMKFAIFCSRVLYLTCYLQQSPIYLFLNRMT